MGGVTQPQTFLGESAQAAPHILKLESADKVSSILACIALNFGKYGVLRTPNLDCSVPTTTDNNLTITTIVNR